MHTLTQFRLCPRSRSIRLALAEVGIEAELADERPWEWRATFLALNPAGELPVLKLEDGPVLCGAYAISEYLADLLADRAKEGRPAPLFLGSIEERAEQRRQYQAERRAIQNDSTYCLPMSKPLMSWSQTSGIPSASQARENALIFAMPALYKLPAGRTPPGRSGSSTSPWRLITKPA